MADDATADPKLGRVQKVLYLDAEGGPVAAADTSSTQLPADPFTTYDGDGLQAPPFGLEQLVYLAEQHPIHSASIEQKAADVVGSGWVWKVADDESKEKPQDGQRKKLDAWFGGLSDERQDETMHEILLSAWEDTETVGHGCIEIARDLNGKVQHVYSLPAHTTRFSRDGKRIVQMRNGRKVWFKRWVPKDKAVVHKATGQLDMTGKAVDPKMRANEILVLRRPARRSSWYGVPKYVSALGWIHLSLSARDDNILFFQNRREPRWAIILSNLEDDPEMEDDIQQAFAVDLAQPHRNIVIPISGAGKVDFKQLSDTKGDMSFERLQARADGAILAAHRMPGERVGMIASGPLGGNAVVGASRVYKEGVVQTSQAILAARINRFIRAESGIENPQWLWSPEELDLTEESADIVNGTQAFAQGLAKLNEGREIAGMDPLDDDDERGEMFITELVNVGTTSEEGGEDEMFGSQDPVSDEPSADEIPLDEEGEQIDKAVRELFSANAG